MTGLWKLGLIILIIIGFVIATVAIADRSFTSRLFLGTGKFPSNDALRGAVAASGTEMVTVALRRVDPHATGEDILDALPEGVLLLTNTSGAVDADEAVRWLDHAWRQTEVVRIRLCR